MILPIPHQRGSHPHPCGEQTPKITQEPRSLQQSKRRKQNSNRTATAHSTKTRRPTNANQNTKPKKMPRSTLNARCDEVTHERREYILKSTTDSLVQPPWFCNCNHILQIQPDNHWGMGFIRETVPKPCRTETGAAAHLNIPLCRQAGLRARGWECGMKQAAALSSGTKGKNDRAVRYVTRLHVSSDLFTYDYAYTRETCM